jgi:hypothetical protein
MRAGEARLSSLPTFHFAPVQKPRQNKWYRLAKNVQFRSDMLASGFLLRFWTFSKLHASSKRSPRAGKTSWLRLFSPCVFGHGDMLRTRDEEGQFALECVSCGHVKRILDQAPVQGPKHRAVPVKGAPVLKVTHLHRRERTFPRSA